MNHVGLLAEVLGDYTAAASHYARALEIYRTAPSDHCLAIATVLNNLAALHQTIGDYIQAKPYYQQALKVTRMMLGEDHPDVATSLNNLADLYVALGRYGEAKPRYQRALEIYRQTLGENHPDVARTLNNLAVLYKMTGDYTRAEEMYRQALEIDRAIPASQHPDVASRLNNLAVLYKAVGNYDEAERLYQEAIQVWRSTLREQHPNVASGLTNLAGLYSATGNYTDAEPLYREALEINRHVLPEDHPAIADSLNNLAGLYYATGNYLKAEPLLQRALDLRRQAFGTHHPAVAQSLNNLGALYKAMGNYTDAEPLYREALEIVRTTRGLGEHHPEFANGLGNLATLLAATERVQQAFTLLEQALAIDDALIGQIFSISSEQQRMAYLATVQWRYHLFLSLSHQQRSIYPLAVQTAFELVLRRKAIGAEALAAQRDAILGGRYPLLAPRLQELAVLRTQISQAQISQAMLVGTGPGVILADQQPLAEWTTRKERLEADLARQIPEMTLEKRLLAVDHRAMAAALPVGAALIEFIRFPVFAFGAVPARGEPEWEPACYVAFVLQAGKPDDVAMIDLGEADSIDRLLAAFRMSITGEAEGATSTVDEPAAPEPVLAANTPDPTTLIQAGGSDLRQTRPRGPAVGIGSDGTALRKTLFDPLLGALGRSTRLVLAPDGNLTRLPFEVLPTGNGRYLIDDYAISYLSVGRDMLRFGASASGQPPAPLVAAAPDFDLNSGVQPQAALPADVPGRRSADLSHIQPFRPLPYTHVEGIQVATMLKVPPLLEAQVLERQLKAHQSPRILHLATHGFFLQDQEHDPNRALPSIEPSSSLGPDRLGQLARLENPLLRSGLALAGANTWLVGGSLPPEAEDGLLTAEDVSGLDLLSTELVVLSACETGLGEVQVGEGVFGLRRAFVLAGAKTLVMSLWKVPDQQTQELMLDFYQRILRQRQSRAVALRAAQLALKTTNPDPLYWGAFICQGDPGPLADPPLVVSSDSAILILAES